MTSPSLERARWLFLALAIMPSVATAANTVLTDVLRKPLPVVVYELPDAAVRERALDFVQLLRKNLSPKAELIDAGAALLEKLPEKLKDGFVLITTLSEQSKLLEKATRGMDWS